jgi:hypothetical protein
MNFEPIDAGTIPEPPMPPSPAITYNKIMTAFPKIKNFKSQQTALHLYPNEVDARINKDWHELRVFSFYMPNSNMTFSEYVAKNKLGDQVLEVSSYPKVPGLTLYTYAINQPDLYLLIVLRRHLD